MPRPVRLAANGSGKAEASLGPIVSSAHLAAGAMPSLSELEFGLILLGHAFERWMVRCVAAAGLPDVNPMEVLVLHAVAHRARPKRLADICLVLSIEDTHLVTYAVKKLEAGGPADQRAQGQRENGFAFGERRGDCKKIRKSARGASGGAGEGDRRRRKALI